MRIPTLLAAAAAAVVTAGLLSSPATAVQTAAAAPAASDVVKIPISFKVKNTNNTDDYCQYAVDGKEYTVRGTVIGPKSAIKAGKAATIYLHAVTWTSEYFNLPIAGHNYAEEMAKRGHVSVLVDRLGYGKSDKVTGLSSCFGSEADILHQEVAALKSGDYTLGSGKTTKFNKVFTAGSSVGGLIANIEAYTFHDSAGVFNQAWGDFTPGPYALEEAFKANNICYQGGDPDRAGYTTFAKDTRDQFWFASATPEVRAKVPAMQQDPCGQIMNLQFGIADDGQHLGMIDVPVLMVFGDADPVFPAPSAQQMQSRYSGSPKVTNVNIPGASHYPILEANFPVMRDAANTWLNENGG
jgi:pimeloyl-ACP methyl ester carboxylesterase